MTEGFRALLTPSSTGWRMAGKGSFRWIAEDVVQTEGGPGLFWYADESFEDFILTIEWRTTRGDDNSGVFIRCPALSDDVAPAIERGYEIQIDDHGFDPASGKRWSPLHITGAIYKLAPARRVTSHGVAIWNEFEITARGAMIAVKLNGEPVSMLENAGRNARGHIALQNHHEGGAVQFRNLRLSPFSPAS